VLSSGAADEQSPSGSGRGREEWGTYRRDRLVSGRGWRGGYGLRGVCAGRPGKEKGRPSQMKSGISDLFKSVLNKFKLI
jgi:hypothetical protein